MTKLRKWLSYGNVTATIAVFLAMSGAAVAVTQAPNNSVTSASIRNGEVKTSDVGNAAITNRKVAANAIGSGKVADNTLTGGDVKDKSIGAPDVEDHSLTEEQISDDTLRGKQIVESSLGEVPVATLGGIGRSGPTSTCNPESNAFEPCSVTQFDLRNPARILVIGTARPVGEPATDNGYGSCRIGSTSGPIEQSTVFGYYGQNLTATAVTGVLPPGTHAVGMDCNEGGGDGIQYVNARVVAVALSDN